LATLFRKKKQVKAFSLVAAVLESMNDDTIDTEKLLHKVRRLNEKIKQKIRKKVELNQRQSLISVYFL